MNKKTKRKKVLIILTILIIFITILTVWLVRKMRSNVAYVAPHAREETMDEDDDKIEYKNTIESIDIGDINVKTIGKKHYMSIEITNKTQVDIFNIPIGIEIINLDGDVIYNSGEVLSVLLKGMDDEVNALITSDVAKLVEKGEIDHIVIK